MTGQTEHIVEERLVEETGLEARIASIIEPVIQSMGYQLVRIRTTGENGMTLQVMAERFDGTMAVEDCEAISRAISPVLEVEDPIEKAYHLEISSPGIDRPMVRKSDFTKWQGHLIKCETSILIEERKRFRGWITSASEDGFVLKRDNLKADEAEEVTIPFATLVEGKLILTDELAEMALRADNQSKKKQRRNAANEN